MNSEFAITHLIKLERSKLNPLWISSRNCNLSLLLPHLEENDSKNNIWTRGALSRAQVSPPGSVDHKSRFVLYGWFPNCKKDFLISMYISGKIFMKIWSAVFVWSCAPLLVFGEGMHCTDDIQNIMRTFFALDVFLAKILWRYVQ